LSYHPAVGTTVRYVKSSGEVESAVVSAVEIHPYAVGFSIPFHDIVVCKFDRDISVPFAKVLPADPSGYLPSVPGDYDEVYSNAFPSDGQGNRVYINACHTNQDKVLAVSKLEILPTSPTPYVAPGSVSPRAGYVRHATGTGEHPLGQDQQAVELELIHFGQHDVVAPVMQDHALEVFFPGMDCLQADHPLVLH